MRERIIDVQSNINDWLKFAEAKHGAILATNIILITEINHSINSGFKFLKLLIIIFALISILISLFSFFPRQHEKIKPKKRINDLDEINMFYARSLSRFTEDELVLFFTKNSNSYKIDRFDLMIINQIHKNSLIASFKYRLIRLSLIFLAIAIILILVLSICNVF